MKTLMTLLILLFLSLSLSAQSYATVNGDAITINDIKKVLKSYKKAPVFSEMSKADKQFVINQAIKAKLIQQTAKKEQINKREDYQKALANIQEQLLVEIWMKKNLENITVTQEEIVNAYKENIADYKQPFQAKVRHIVVKTKKQAQEIINELNGVKTNVQEKFIELANTKSIEPSADTRGGDLGWIKKGDVLKEFWQESLSLKLQQYSKTPLKTPFGYHIVFLENKKESYTIGLENVFTSIEDKLKMKKFQDSIDKKLQEIRKNSDISIN